MTSVRSSGNWPLVLLLAFAASASGCLVDDKSNPTTTKRCTGDRCSNDTAVGSGSGSSGNPADGGTGGGAESGSLSGALGRFVDERLASTQSYSGPATIIAPAAGGGAVSVQAGGADPPTFTLTGVLGGPQWVLTVNDDPGADVLSTYTIHDVPGTGDAMPVVDLAVLGIVAGQLTGAPLVEAGAGHAVVALARAGAAVAGVRVADGTAAGALVGYDTGMVGGYTDQSDATDVAGRILLLNATASSAGGQITLRVVEDDGTTHDLLLPLRGDTLTVASFELP